MKNLTAIAVCIILCTSLFSQDSSTTSDRLLGGTDITQKKVEYGILIGASYYDLVESNTNSSQSLDKAYGMNVGILSTINFSPKLSLVPQAIIHFRDNNIIYTDIDGNPLDELGVNNVTIELPLHLSYQPFDAMKNSPGIVAGPRYRYNFTNGAIFNYRTHQATFDLGLSMDFVFEKFKIKPVFMYSRGISNLLPSNITINSDGKFKMHSYNFSLLFFG